MLLSSLRMIGQRGPSIASRAFSTTSPASAAEVKSLGVIGAGQMVGNAPHTHVLFNDVELDADNKFRGWELLWWLPRRLVSP
jgi:hypothetical protein